MVEPSKRRYILLYTCSVHVTGYHMYDTCYYLVYELLSYRELLSYFEKKKQSNNSVVALLSLLQLCC